MVKGVTEINMGHNIGPESHVGSWDNKYQDCSSEEASQFFF